MEKTQIRDKHPGSAALDSQVDDFCARHANASCTYPPLPPPPPPREIKISACRWFLIVLNQLPEKLLTPQYILPIIASVQGKNFLTLTKRFQVDDFG
jgi:hypothetical protein